MLDFADVLLPALAFVVCLFRISHSVVVVEAGCQLSDVSGSNQNEHDGFKTLIKWLKKCVKVDGGGRVGTTGVRMS